MTRRPWKLLSLGVLAALVGGPGLAAAQPVKVGAVVPLTGRYGAGGAQGRAGYEIAAGGVDVLDGDLVARANLRPSGPVTPGERHDGSDLDRLSCGQSRPADERGEDSEAQELPRASGHDALLFDAILMMSPGRRNHPWVGRGRASGRGYSACDRPSSTRRSEPSPRRAAGHACG